MEASRPVPWPEEPEAAENFAIVVKRRAIPRAAMAVAIALLTACSAPPSHAVPPENPSPTVTAAPEGQSSVHARDIPVSKSVTINPAPGGGTIGVPHFASFSGRFAYAPNNARTSATLTLTNSGQTNLFGAPTPTTALRRDALPGGITNNWPLLFLAAQVGGTKALEFAAGTYHATLSSDKLVAGSAYTMYLYVANQQAGTIALGSASADHTLRFATPFAGVSIRRNAPLIMEVIGQR